MKETALITAIIIFSGLSTATIATYTGDTMKQGPEAEYMIGIASDQERNIELELEEVEGLEISYNTSLTFRPDESDKVLQRNGREYSLMEIYINVESVNVSKERYEIPVTFRAFNDQSSEGTRPHVIHEREYGFSYVTDLSSDFGIDGNLISGGEKKGQIKEDEPDEALNVTSGEENTLTGQNQTDSKGEKDSSGPGQTTFLLIGAIIALTLYIIREAFT